jgi:hypothetical protein
MRWTPQAEWIVLQILQAGLQPAGDNELAQIICQTERGT